MDSEFNRRDFLKKAGLIGGALSLAGAAGAGFAAGSIKDSYTGWGRTAYGGDQFFNRKPFNVDNPTYEQIGTPRRIEYIEDLFKRLGELRRAMSGPEGERWTFDQGAEELPEPLRSYYLKHPGGGRLTKRIIKYVSVNLSNFIVLEFDKW